MGIHSRALVPLNGLALAIMTFSLGLGTFIQILDTSIANVAVPKIAADFGVTPQQGTWVITSFAVSNAIILPLTGWLVTRFGGVSLFAWSTSLFSLASLLCGMAWNFQALVIFRVIQGAVAGCLIPLSQSLLLTNYPTDKKGLALGFWSMIVVVAPVLGPIVGGWLTDFYGWRWIFYINIPLGILSALITWVLLRFRENKKERVPVDLIGLSLLTIGIGSLQIFLDNGNMLGWFQSNVIIALALSAVIGLSTFIVWNLHSAYPLVNFAFFQDRNFLISTIVSAIGFLIVFGSTVLISLWLQTRMGYTALLAGVAIMPVGILPILLTPLVGFFINRISLRILSTISFVIFAITNFWFSTFSWDVTLHQIMTLRFFQGFGLALFFIPLITMALSNVRNEAIASASGVYNFIRLVTGGGVGTALYVLLWDQFQQVHIKHLNGLPQAVEHSYMFAFTDLMYLSGWLFLGLIPFVWLCREPKA